ncbi:hypothetical protein E8L90_25510 [Brevibacillus antibioticus]|uniref:Uncharacterized protein n=1 Tax=Brevibacillus antibioticus TaxID=2570228 RepID=A0A4U2YED0_9BACL|nr:hypothetical protein [Brevibacillus antibioticus]TKI58482.1 hypothetical protein E8L90_25510 [Brevibacillus antibioticus]
MNLDKLLAEFKQTADQTLLHGMDDTTKLEEQIRMSIENKRKKKFRFTYSVSAALIAVALVIGFTPYWLQKENAGVNTTIGTPVQQSTNQTSGPNATAHAFDDQKIKETAEEIFGILRVGMTQDQVKEKLSFPHIVIDDYGGSGDDYSDEYWGYNIFAKEGYQRKEDWIMEETEGLLNRDLGLELLIFWRDKKVNGYGLSYVQGKEIHSFGLNRYGTYSESISKGTANSNEEYSNTPAPSTIFDLEEKEMRQRYFAYMEMEEKTDELWRGLSPIDIMKLYVQAQRDVELEIMYALHSNDDGVEKPTLEQYLEEIKKDPVGARNSARHFNKLLELGSSMSVEYTSDKEAIVWISFKDNSEKVGYRMEKNKKGIWKVGWRALQ